MGNEPLSRFSMDYFSLKGKTAIITGANMGLGMAYALAFAKAGADIYIPHFTDDVDEIKQLVEAEGRKAAFIQGDLTEPGSVQAVVAGCLKEYGKIDILVNNAGVSTFGEFEEYPDAQWKRCIELDLNVVYYLGHETAKVMIKQRSGKIINIGSALSYTADKKCPPYVAAKHGVIGLTRSFANELGAYNIQTNAICPGFLATEVNRELREDQAFYDKITNRIPAGRWGELDDLMGTAVFLASKASDYINGWNISIDGGFTTTL
ncbi:MAG: SDR family oxidoreductase [Clostridiales Family XIII bacterium]|jgi:2-deoxy-D-gluconate 3-dehydrogenase|nr:SDR family oxidoreductase [Clostridiales Family XIII bacterium]